MRYLTVIHEYYINPTFIILINDRATNKFETNFVLSIKGILFICSFYCFNIYHFIYFSDSDHLGTKPSILQYWDGLSWSEIWSLPPSLTSSFLILKNVPAAWTDLSFQTPWPDGTGTHCWLVFPVLSHWTTFDPLCVFYSAISRHCPFKRLWRRYPFPDLTHFHLWLNFLFFSYWISLSPC